ncbi:hypothetical protein ABK040_011733 [Willaertia magna]
MVSNTRRNNEDNEGSSQQSSFQGFTFGHTQLSGQNASTINNLIQLPNVGSSQGSSHAPVQSTTRNTGSHTPTTVLGEGNANDYLQSNFNNVNNNSGQQNNHDSRTNSSNRANNAVPLGTNNSVHNSDMIYNRPDYNPNPRSNTGFQFAINNSNNNPQTTRNNSSQENATPGELISLFSNNTGSGQQNNNNNVNRNEVDLKINSVVAEECYNMGLELIAFGYNKEEVEAMNASELFFYYSKMHSQLHLVYNNEVAFQKRIESLLSKYHSYLNNPDELALFTSDNCQYITSEVIKYDFQIYNYLGRLGVHLVHSSDLVERQELQELMVLLIALRRLSLKFGAENNNMNMGSELISSYLKSDTLESALSKKLTKLAKKHKEGKIMETLASINKVKPNTGGYAIINKKNMNVGGYNNKGRIEKSNKIGRHKGYLNNKSNNSNINNDYGKKSNNKFQNKPNNNNNDQ